MVMFSGNFARADGGSGVAIVAPQRRRQEPGFWT